MKRHQTGANVKGWRFDVADGVRAVVHVRGLATQHSDRASTRKVQQSAPYLFLNDRMQLV